MSPPTDGAADKTPEATEDLVVKEVTKADATPPSAEEGTQPNSSPPIVAEPTTTLPEQSPIFNDGSMPPLDESTVVAQVSASTEVACS